MLVGEFLVHAEHVAHLAAAYAYIAGRYVGVGAQMAPQLQHEGLAEAHDLSVGFAARTEVRTTFGTAHGQRGKCIFESLLESEEFQYREVYRCVESNAAFVRADGIVELYAVAQVYLYVAVIVYPGYFEGNDSVGFDKPLDQFGFFELGVLVVYLFDRE